MLSLLIEAYRWLIVPLSSSLYTLIAGHALPVVPPAMDPNLLMLIGSLLGVNIGARSVEKLKSVASLGSRQLTSSGDDVNARSDRLTGVSIS